MSGSVAEVQELAVQILELLGVRMRAGQLVIHFNDGLVQRCETNTVHRARAADRRPVAVDRLKAEADRRLLADRRQTGPGT